MSSPRPPVLIGGTGERRTLRLVAQYGDACNLFDVPDGGRAIRRQLDVLAHHCADVGRPAEEVERTVCTALQPGESADQLVTRLPGPRRHRRAACRGHHPWRAADRGRSR